MWIFNRDGFFSAVENWDNKKTVVVRARFREDLHNLKRRLWAIQKGKRAIKETFDADYPFRMVVSKVLWGTYLAQTGEEIDYPNFKSSIDKARSHIYMGVWAHMQASEVERPKGKRVFENRLFGGRPDWWRVCIILAIMVFAFVGTGLAGEKTQKIYDKNWKTQGYVRDGKIYDKDWNTKGYIRGDRVYDKDWNHKLNIEEEK